jgi:hypothetical protein
VRIRGPWFECARRWPGAGRHRRVNVERSAAARPQLSVAARRRWPAASRRIFHRSRSLRSMARTTAHPARQCPLIDGDRQGAMSFRARAPSSASAAASHAGAATTKFLSSPRRAPGATATCTRRRRSTTNATPPRSGNESCRCCHRTPAG